MPYHSIEDPATLRRVLEATLLLEADLDLPTLLRHIVDEARSMTGAQYAALGVLNDDGTALSQFITVGLEPDEEDRIGPRPTRRAWTRRRPRTDDGRCLTFGLDQRRGDAAAGRARSGAASQGAAVVTLGF